MNRKTILGVAIGTVAVAITAFVFHYRRKIVEARGHFPIGKDSIADRQVALGEWPGGFTVRPE